MRHENRMRVCVCVLHNCILCIRYVYTRILQSMCASLHNHYCCVCSRLSTLQLEEKILRSETVCVYFLLSAANT